MSKAATRRVIMPALGMTQDSGEIVAWHKQVGDAVNPDDILMEVETDKTTLEVEAGFDGFVTEIKFAAGTSVAVGEVIAVLSESAGDCKSITQLHEPVSGVDAQTIEPVTPTSDLTSTPAELKPSTGTLIPTPIKQSQKLSQKPLRTGQTILKPTANTRSSFGSGSSRILASPKARLAAHEKGIDLTRLIRRGVEVPIQLGDVQAFQFSAKDSSASQSQLQAKVASQHFGEFIQWLGDTSGGQAGASTAWCVFGAAAIRHAMQYTFNDDVLVRCESWVNREFDFQSNNPDSSGLLSVQVDESFDMPDLLIRDMTGTAFFNYQSAEADTSINLIVVEHSENQLSLSLSFDEDHIELSQALLLLEYLGERIEQPLKHLL